VKPPSLSPVCPQTPLPYPQKHHSVKPTQNSNNNNSMNKQNIIVNKPQIQNLTTKKHNLSRKKKHTIPSFDRTSWTTNLIFES